MRLRECCCVQAGLALQIRNEISFLRCGVSIKVWGADSRCGCELHTINDCESRVGAFGHRQQCGRGLDLLGVCADIVWWLRITCFQCNINKMSHIPSYLMCLGAAELRGLIGQNSINSFGQ